MPDPSDELIDYEEDEETLQISAGLTTTENGKDASTATTAGAEKAVKKGYVGVHSTGFRDFLLKPELLRAIVDCGFEHPSEGMLLFFIDIEINLISLSISPAGVHSSGHPRYGCFVPGRFWNGKDCRFRPCHTAAD